VIRKVLDCEPVRVPVSAAVIPALLLPAVALAPALRSQPWTPLRIAGAAGALTGCALLITARMQLGGSFSIRPQAKQLVTRGLYSKIRRPMYRFFGIMLADWILVSGVPWRLACLALGVTAQAIRARREERMLDERFGQAYWDCRSWTWI
jgi:protein-S-isoprenylcysteine O-methyltransferase Ste14